MKTKLESGDVIMTWWPERYLQRVFNWETHLRGVDTWWLDGIAVVNDNGTVTGSVTLHGRGTDWADECLCYSDFRFDGNILHVYGIKGRAFDMLYETLFELLDAETNK